MCSQPGTGTSTERSPADSGAPGEPLFSVVLPTYCRPDWLAEAIASVLRQSIADFELVVVDDASVPPAEVPDDARIKLIRLDENVGPAGARNVGWELARGRYVTFLDDDDLYTPDRLAIAEQGLQRAPIAICWSRFIGAPLGRNRTFEGNVAGNVLDDLTPNLGVTAVRRDLAVRFDERWQAVEDLDWWLRAAQQFEVATVPRIGYLIRIHDSPRWRNDTETRVRENLELLDAHADYFVAHPTAAAFRLKRAGLLSLQARNRPRARMLFRRSLGLDPRAATVWHLLRACRPVLLRGGHQRRD